MSDRESTSDDRFLDVAVDIACRNIRQDSADRNLGYLESWSITDGELGTMLRIVFVSNLDDGARVRYERLIRPTGDPGMEPETKGMIFSATFEERLRTARRVPLGADDDSDFRI